jgi:small subunit ribosomal protein S16
MKDPAVVKIHEDKVNYWVEKGARVSEAVQAILKNEGKVQSHSAPN